jgi:hypothetical protein
MVRKQIYLTIPCFFLFICNAISVCLVHIVDWLPTLVGLAGGRVVTETDGLDVWTALTTGQGPTRNTLGMSTFFPGNMKKKIEKCTLTNFTHLKKESIFSSIENLEEETTENSHHRGVEDRKHGIG